MDANGDPTTDGYAAEACEAEEGSSQAQIDACAGISITGTDFSGAVGTDRRSSCEGTADPCVYIPRGSRARHPGTGWPYAALQLELSQAQRDDLNDGDNLGQSLGAGIEVGVRVCSDRDIWCGCRALPPFNPRPPWFGSAVLWQPSRKLMHARAPSQLR